MLEETTNERTRAREWPISKTSFLYNMTSAFSPFDGLPIGNLEHLSERENMFLLKKNCHPVFHLFLISSNNTSIGAVLQQIS